LWYSKECMDEESIQPINVEAETRGNTQESEDKPPVIPVNISEVTPPENTQTSNAQTKKRKRKPLTCFEIWTIVLGSIGILVAAGTGFAIYFQEKIASRTLIEIQKQYPALKESADAARDGAAAATIAANTAQKSFKQSIESFRIDERAWIEIQPIALPSNPTARLGAFRYELYPKNIGKTAATDIKITVLRGSQESSITLGDNASNINRSQDMLVNGALSDIPRVNPISNVLAPNTVATVPFIMDGQAPQIFTKDEWVSYLIGRIDYTDAFNIPHWLKFCFFVVDARGTLWNCKGGNDEDRNPELAPN
jgi:hypothetical protein